MTLRARLLEAHRRAASVLSDSGARRRVDAERRSRIDPVELAEAAGVAVMAQRLEQLLGAFLREGSPGILLNSERPIGMVHMTCAHELGHFFLGHVSTADSHIDYTENSDPREQEANQFAYSLLTPRWLIGHAMAAKAWNAGDLSNPMVVYQLSLRLGVSYAAMVWSLLRLKLVRQPIATSLAKQPPKNLKRRLLPAGMDPPAGDVWDLDERDKDWIIEPRQTDRFVVSLPSHASAGYLWTTDDARSDGFTLRPALVDARQVQRAPAPPQVGGRQRDAYLLEVDTGRQPQGQVAVRLQEARPWDGGGQSASELALAVQFERFNAGLSEGTRRRALSE